MLCVHMLPMILKKKVLEDAQSANEKAHRIFPASDSARRRSLSVTRVQSMAVRVLRRERRRSRYSVASTPATWDRELKGKPLLRGELDNGQWAIAEVAVGPPTLASNPKYEQHLTGCYEEMFIKKMG